MVSGVKGNPEFRVAFFLLQGRLRYLFRCGSVAVPFYFKSTTVERARTGRMESWEEALASNKKLRVCVLNPIRDVQRSVLAVLCTP